MLIDWFDLPNLETFAPMVLSFKIVEFLSLESMMMDSWVIGSS